jgi:protein-disulfide isomerase
MRQTTKRSMLLATLVLSVSPVTLRAQSFGTNPPNVFRNLSVLKPPAGSKVAIVVFEDLGCPGCAYAHPIEQDTAKRANVPLVRYDFPLAAHIWTFQGAVCARYIQNKVSPQLADQYRGDVFKAQSSIANKDDLERFTQVWLQRHGQQMPFVMDPDGSLTKAVQADYDLGLHINLTHTPTILVVTKDHQQIVCGTGTPETNDPSRIYPVVEAALSQTVHATPAPSHRSQ